MADNTSNYNKNLTDAVDGQVLNRNMRLFGLPYQFLKEVDPRVDSVSSVIGRKFAENIILDAPIISIIPGKPKFCPDKSTSEMLVNAASGDFSVLKNIENDDVSTTKFYDFQKDYSTYMQYVNILCRTCASFLELDETIDGITCQTYDYRNYRWNNMSSDGVMKGISSTIRSCGDAFKNFLSSVGEKVTDIVVTKSDTEVSNAGSSSSTEMVYESSSGSEDEDESFEDLITNYNYVQFFVDTDVSAGESMNSSTRESALKGLFETGGNYLKDLAFMLGSGGFDTEQFQDFADSSTNTLASIVDSMGSGGLTTTLSRVLTLSGNVVKGENVIMPDIFDSFKYDRSYQFTVHLKTPYGTKFGYFIDICVPLMHLLALGIPKQTTANTYGSPFLLKAYVEGVFNCNMGMITSISVTRGSNATSFSVDGLPTEVDVSVSMVDMYSDLSMSPQSSPVLFIRNSSMIEYLATTCGLSLISPNMQIKFDLIVNSIKNSFTDVDDTVKGRIQDILDQYAMDFFSLSW